MAVKYRRRFPRALDGAPFLLPGETSTLRPGLEQWLGIRPRIIGEFDDCTLIKAFGQAGKGIFAALRSSNRACAGKYGVTVVGRLDWVRERFYTLCRGMSAHRGTVYFTAATLLRDSLHK